MQVGLIGLGKMGLNVAQNLKEKGYDVKGYDLSEDALIQARDVGVDCYQTVQSFVQSLETPRVIWVMVPSGEPTDHIVGLVSDQLNPGDVIIEAGNSNYQSTLALSKKVKAKGIHFIDVGTSGGMSGARHGACLMIGCEKSLFQTYEPLFKAIACVDGYMYAGENGSAHFLKMVHNGIEYAMMQAIGEGFELLKKSPFEYDLEAVASVWNHGSVIRGWLMELTQNAFSKDPQLATLKGIVHSSGEAKWTVETALALQVPIPVISTSTFMRFRTLEEDNFGAKLVAALRNEFGGHAVIKK